MKTIRIFISAPEDVAEERQKACDVIASLQPRYVGRFRLVPVLREDLALQVDASFQQGIDMVLSSENGIDVAVFILWSQLGFSQGASAGNGGTAIGRDFTLMLGARETSGGTRPAILAYRRNDPDGFLNRQKGQPLEGLEDMLRQRRLAENFIAATFGDTPDGKSGRALHVFTQPVEFAHRLRVHVREILDGLLGEGGAATWDVSEMGAPFRGLDAFEPQHAGIFFGREDEICAVQLALRRQASAGSAFVLIVGASGSGKSSLARAGVLPAVTQFDLDDTVRSWRTAIFIPGTAAKDLCLGLARMLCSALPELRESDTSLEAFAAGLRENPALTCRLVLPNALGSGVRLFLLLDQFEEIFSHSSIGPGDRVAFITAIDALARSGSVWVLATVRSDFYEQCQTLPRLMEMKGVHGQFDLLPPDADDLRRIITAPASLAGLRYEKDDSTGEALDRRLLADATRHPEALPLLEYALRELFERREPDGTLTLAQYRELGGVEGALGHRAEAVFLALPVAVQTALDGVFSALVTVREDVDAGATRARVPTESAASTPERERLIAAFVKERLFFTDRDASTGESILTLSHEALLRCWPRAEQWIDHNRDFLRVRARLREGVRAWTENDRAADYFLPPGKPLEDARTLLAARGDDLAQTERDYIAESIEHAGKRERAAKRRRGLALAAMAILTAIAVAGGAVALIKTEAARDAARTADAQRALAEDATRKAEAQADNLAQQKAKATAAQETAEVERKRAEEQRKLAEEATAQANAQAEALKLKEAEATAARKTAEEKKDRAWALIDYMRGPLQRTLSDDGGRALLHDVRKKIADFYAAEGVDESDTTQLVRLAEDASKEGDTAAELADSKAAEKSYRNALGIRKRLLERDPANNDWQFQLSVSLGKLGDAQMAQVDLESAAASYGEALQIRRKLVERDPARNDWRLGLSVSLEKIGDIEARKNRLLAAAGNYEESQKLLMKMASGDPGNRTLQRSLSVSLSRVGDNRRAQGDLEGAAASHGQVIKILKDLYKDSPESPDLQRELSQSFTKLGNIEQTRGNSAGAAENLLQATDILRKLVAGDSENTGWQLQLGANLALLASIQNDQRDYLSAEKNYVKAVEILKLLDKAAKLSGKNAEFLDISRGNLESVREKLRTGKK